MAFVLRASSISFGRQSISLESKACRVGQSQVSSRRSFARFEGFRAIGFEPTPLTKFLRRDAHFCSPQSGFTVEANISSNELRNGTTIVVDNALYKVVEFLHVKPGKGSAFVRTKLRNVQTGGVVEKTFRAGESLESASVEKKEMQHTYVEGDQYVFMDMETYDEARLSATEIGDGTKWLIEGMTVNVMLWNDKVIDVELPTTVDLVIVSTDPGIKGNTVSGGNKPATLSTGAVVQVPLFIEEGEKIKIDTRTGTYLSRIQASK
mmetsp:Transcript_17878/g.30841  ORF Transcript_17878/g.30841 Transcript_17878/m.30841 type:complete len:264 (+) Transcript_17878:83-874(+)|eukprot:CAMPEP_0196653652 /NCGR_PEP_ID=MMETSP1086-20130531/3310_1 /TAXON_ID=77921 /ORGANISM="Cyanoptyche  gloeocystis , Strain SAG4.97" /LENGTH=263 /DNA_ID=CAMNT_0041984965 /DNA_START=60 /DNA_END=851 /DNA_ORIENTATION=-